jgi:hypothetical protein
VPVLSSVLFVSYLRTSEPVLSSVSSVALVLVLPSAVSFLLRTLVPVLSDALYCTAVSFEI